MEKGPPRKRSRSTPGTSPEEEEDQHEGTKVGDHEEEGGSGRVSLLDALPYDLLVGLMTWLSPRDLAACALVSRAFQSLSKEDSHWRERCERVAAVREHWETLRLVLRAEEVGGGRPVEWQQLYRHLARPARCKRCGISFSQLTNGPEACSWHPGRWEPSLSQADSWSCCNRTLRHAVGCEGSWHKDAASWLGI